MKLTRRSITTIALVVLTLAVILPLSFAHLRFSAQRLACRNTMQSYGLGFLMYSGDHGDRFPDHIKDCSRYVAHLTKIFICPATGHTPGETFDDFETWSDYVYIPGCTETSPPTRVVAYCRPENHGAKGGNILFRDGHAEWFWSENSWRARRDGPTFEQVIRDGLPPPPDREL